MQEQEENIQFDSMPDFGKMFDSQKESVWDSEKEYDTLRDELLDKCQPGRFINEENFDQEQFNLANRLYAKVLQLDGSSDDELKQIRDCAMDELGVHISTKKKYEYLDKFLNPKQYTEMQPYDMERVNEAGKWYAILLQNKSDIRALEALELDAFFFINQRKLELEAIANKEEEARQQQINAELQKNEMDDEEEDTKNFLLGICGIILMVGIIIFLISTNANK